MKTKARIFSVVAAALGIIFLIFCSTILIRPDASRFKYMASTKESNNTRPAKDPASPEVGKRHILLVTYGRSGSSITAAIISHYKDVFYTFEPLYPVKLPEGSGKSNYYRNTMENASRGIIDSYLDCRFSNESIAALENDQLQNSDSTRKIWQCVYGDLSPIKALQCYNQFLHACQSSKISFIKTVRVCMSWMTYFLDTHPRLQVLFLMRDPRAVIYSHAQVFHTLDWSTQAGEYAQQHCQAISEDLDATIKLSELYPGRVKGIRYETGALDPIQFTKNIYAFLNFSLTNETLKFVENMTSSRNRDTSPYNLSKDSKKAMESWRYNAGIKSVAEVDKKCSFLYDQLGYVAVTSQKALEDPSISLVKKPSVSIF